MTQISMNDQPLWCWKVEWRQIEVRCAVAKRVPFKWNDRGPDWMDSWKRGKILKTFNIDSSFQELCCKGKERNEEEVSSKNVCLLKWEKNQSFCVDGKN